MHWTTPPKHPSERSAQLLALLSTAADNELLTHQLYAQFLQSPCPQAFLPSTALLELASAEDKDHFEAIDECITRLRRSDNHHHWEQVGTPKRTHSRQSQFKLLETIGNIEARSVQLYAQICALSMEFDYQVFDLSYRNMHDNMLHMNSLKDFLSQAKLGDPELSLPQ